MRASARTFHNDDATTQTTLWDPANQFNWSSMVSMYDAQGHLVSQSGVYDDGTIWHI